MNSAQEILRLQDLLPASWRMTVHITSKSDQTAAIASTPLLPWVRTTQITLNLKQWLQLSVAQRDLLLLREVAWRQSSRWFQGGVYQSLTALSLVSLAAEIAQADVAGIAIAAMLGGVSVQQIWRRQRGTQVQIDADNEALKVAQRRGYEEKAAARALLEGIQTLARLEERHSLEFTELIRCQNMRAIAGMSAVSVPSDRL